MIKSIIFFSLIFYAFSADAQRKNILFDGNFNGGDLSKFPHREIFDSKAQLITDSVKRYGQVSVRSEVKSSNLGDKGIRSEFAFDPDSNSERWYSVSIFAPVSYLPDTEPEIVTQWHNKPDFNLGEGWTSPSIALWVVNGDWNFHIAWDTARVTIQNKWMGHVFTNLGPVKLNAWTDWVFHIKFSYGNDGIVEVYRDGVKVLNRIGPNNYNDALLPYWKVGIYKWVYKDHRPLSHKFNNRVLYYSQIRKGNEKATYKDMAPR